VIDRPAGFICVYLWLRSVLILKIRVIRVPILCLQASAVVCVLVLPSMRLTPHVLPR